MCDADQDMRNRALANDGIVETKEDEELDSKNTQRMKEIIAEIGWPTVSKVGKDISYVAWLLVQHADRDVVFQRHCLDLMKAEPVDEVNIRNIAYLEDRVCVNEKRPQVYGTQFFDSIVDGEKVYGPRPIGDPEHVEERRKEVGLETLEEYRQHLIKKYDIKE